MPLGASERDVRKRYPNAHCKALEWESKAADRRCDDAKAVFAGIEARITFYLKKGVVEAFDVRFDTRFADRIASTLKGRYGKPVSEERRILTGLHRQSLRRFGADPQAAMTAVARAILNLHETITRN